MKGAISIASKVQYLQQYAIMVYYNVAKPWDFLHF